MAEATGTLARVGRGARLCVLIPSTRIVAADRVCAADEPAIPAGQEELLAAMLGQCPLAGQQVSSGGVRLGPLYFVILTVGRQTPLAEPLFSFLQGEVLAAFALIQGEFRWGGGPQWIGIAIAIGIDSDSDLVTPNAGVRG